MGDKDTEAPPEECVAKLQAAKVAGAPAGVGRLAALAFTARRRPSRTRRLVGADRDALHGYLRLVTEL